MADIPAFLPSSLAPRIGAMAFAVAQSVGVLAHAETVNLECRLRNETNVAFSITIDYGAQLVDMLYVNPPGYHGRRRAKISDTQIYWQNEDVPYPAEYFLDIYTCELHKNLHNGGNGAAGPGNTWYDCQKGSPG
jgi:hypothetical protein